jgi:hypothetical protein
LNSKCCGITLNSSGPLSRYFDVTTTTTTTTTIVTTTTIYLFSIPDIDQSGYRTSQ